MPRASGRVFRRHLAFVPPCRVFRPDLWVQIDLLPIRRLQLVAYEVVFDFDRVANENDYGPWVYANVPESSLAGDSHYRPWWWLSIPLGREGGAATLVARGNEAFVTAFWRVRLVFAVSTLPQRVPMAPWVTVAVLRRRPEEVAPEVLPPREEPPRQVEQPQEPVEPQKGAMVVGSCLDQTQNKTTMPRDNCWVPWVREAGSLVRRRLHWRHCCYCCLVA